MSDKMQVSSQKQDEDFYSDDETGDDADLEQVVE